MNLQTSTIKAFNSPDYSFVFSKTDGRFVRWGKTHKDDPQYSPFGPEIADIEISTICSQGCKWCYKSNTKNGKNMSLDTFKRVFEVLPKETLTQIAFGIGDLDANPDMFPIFKYTRDNGVIPNVTINGSRLNEEIAHNLVDICGAVAVSNYDKDICYNAVCLLTSYGLKQVNIHQLLSEDTYQKCMDTLMDYTLDDRLDKLNAIVFLSLKQKGRGYAMKPTSKDKFKNLVSVALDGVIPIGFDSCSANAFLEVAHKLGRYDLDTCIEPCESSLFSAYIDVDACFTPCSFSSGKWPSQPIIGHNFLTEVWNSEMTQDFRKVLLKNGRNCPFYKVIDN